MSLTDAHRKELMRPFAPEAVGFRADAKTPDRSGNVRCVVYIDARLARERLSDVDPAWSAAPPVFLGAYTGDPIGLQCYLPVLQALTLHGVTRYGTGQATGQKASGNVVKAAVSDAFKRAAVEFHVGAYLYALKDFKAHQSDCWTVKDKDRNGKEIDVVKALNRSAILNLRKQYADMIEHQIFVDRFGTATQDGTHQDDDRGTDAPDDEPTLLDAPTTTRARTRGSDRKVSR